MNGQRLAGALALVAALGVFGVVAGAQQSAAPGTLERSYARTPAELEPYRNGVAPHRFFYRVPPQYRGEGRALPPPASVASVRIGLLMPMDAQAHDGAGVAIGRGVRLALEEENARAGYDGIPFEIVARDDSLLWGSSANTLVELAFDQRVWAVIGSVDADSTHVALRVALKAEVPMVNVGATDPTLTETGIPWIVRTTPDDRQTGYRLAQLLFEQEAHERVAVLRSSDRYGRAGVREFRDAARRLGRPLPMEILFAPDTDDFSVPLQRIAGADVDAVVLWASARDGGRIVRQMRALGMSHRVVGTDRLASDGFLAEAGAAAEGVTMTAWPERDAGDPERTRFEERFERRFDERPSAAAAQGYDAAKLLVQAIRRAGLNRARIRDELAGTQTYDGVAGTMLFDATSNNIAPLRLLTVRAGTLTAATGTANAEPATTPPGLGPALRLGIVLEPGAAGDDLMAGALRAADEANARGGVRGQRVEIVPVMSPGGWIDVGSTVARATVESRLHALLGAVSGGSAHVVAQVATRMRIPAIVFSPETSLTAAGDPWVFRRAPSDLEQARALLQTVRAAGPLGRVVAVVPEGRDGRERLGAIREAAHAAGATIASVVRPGEALPENVDVVALWLDVDAAMKFIRRHRASLPNHLLGSSRLMAPEFLALAADLGPVRVALASAAPADTADEGPVAAAVMTDELARAGVGEVIAAASRGGLEPAQIRDALASARIAGERLYDDRGGVVAGVRVVTPGQSGLARPGGE